MHDNDQQAILTLLILAIAGVFYYWRPRWRGSGTAHGTASWASEREMRRNGLFSRQGLILGRSVSGKLITLASFCHVLLIGGTGSGKGASIFIPALLRYFRGSVVCFDTKGDLFTLTANVRRRKGQRIVHLAPFSGGTDKWNPLACVRAGPMLVDDARAIAEALVVRQGTEPDQHWNEMAVIVICGILVYVLLAMKPEECNLNSVREISSDPALLATVAEKLTQMGNIPARMGHAILGLQDKEKSGVMSTVGRHLAFLDSELVAAAVASSTFKIEDLRKPGTTLFVSIPPDQLLAQRGLLRCWMSTLIRVMGQAEGAGSEILFLIDEAGALSGLAALEEALVRGRSAGIRLLLGFQGESQVRSMFKDKPTLIHENCDTSLYLCPPASFETAELIAKRLGDQTIQIESANENQSMTWQTGGKNDDGQRNCSWGRNYSEAGRPLKKPEEVMTMSPDYLIAFCRGMNPILARRVKWYADPEFGTASWMPPPLLWLLFAACLALVAIIIMAR